MSRAGLPADRDAEQLRTQSTLTGWKGRTILAHSPPALERHGTGPPQHSLYLPPVLWVSLPPPLSFPPSACHSLLTPRPSLLPSLSLFLSPSPLPLGGVVCPAWRRLAQWVLALAGSAARSQLVSCTASQVVLTENPRARRLLTHFIDMFLPGWECGDWYLEWDLRGKMLRLLWCWKRG